MITEVGEYQYSASVILGRGAFGVVYKGWNKKTGAGVAIKVIKDSSITDTTKREFEILENLDHENVVKVLYIRRNMHGDSYIVLELCDGSLEKKKMNSQEIRDFIRQSVAGLSYLHGNNIIHRDIKPANILYKSKGGSTTYKINDFGLAKNVQGTGVVTGIGSRRYMAPEIYKGERASFNSDVYSLGITIRDLAKNPNDDQLRYLIEKMTVNDRNRRLCVGDILDNMSKKRPARNQMTFDEVLDDLSQAQGYYYNNPQPGPLQRLCDEGARQLQQNPQLQAAVQNFYQNRYNNVRSFLEDDD